MKKSQYCTDHFVLSCKLCGMETTSEAVVVAPLLPAESKIVPFTTPIPTEAVGLPAGGSYINVSAVEVPKIHSEEAQAVMSVTDEYARACDELERANDAVFRMREHIDKMQEGLVELIAEESSKRNKKNDLKRKVLETLAMGGE